MTRNIATCAAMIAMPFFIGADAPTTQPGYSESFETLKPGALSGQAGWSIADAGGTWVAEVTAPAHPTGAADGNNAVRITDASPAGLIIEGLSSDALMGDGAKVSFCIRADTPPGGNLTALQVAPLACAWDITSLDVPMHVGILANGNFMYTSDRNSNGIDSGVQAQVEAWYRFDITYHWAPEDNGRTHYDLTITDVRHQQVVLERKNEMGDHVGDRHFLGGFRLLTDSSNATPTTYWVDAFSIQPAAQP